MSVSADTAAQNSITDWYSQEHDYNYNFDSAVFSGSPLNAKRIAHLRT